MRGRSPSAFGTQTAGSVVRPAAYCGVVGYKPTYGTVNRVGVKMISDTLDTIGALGRSVPDVALLVAAASDRRELLIEAPQAHAPRIGMCRTQEWNRAQPETLAMFERAKEQLIAAGGDVRDVTLPPLFEKLADGFRDIRLALNHLSDSLLHLDNAASPFLS